jgi:hypothetical protein
MNIIVLNPLKSLVAKVLETPTNQIAWSAHFYDSSTTVSESSNVGVLDDGNYISLVDAPAVDARIVKEVTFFNPDDYNQTLIIALDVDGVKTVIWKGTLAPGSIAVFSDLVSNIIGTNGKNPQFQKTATHLQYRITDDIDWIDLVPLDDIKGIDANEFVIFKTPVTAATASFETADRNKYIECNRATDITYTIPLATLEKGAMVTLEQIGAGVVNIVVADGAKQTINSAASTWGVNTVIQLLCKSDTTDAEIYVVTGGV